MNPPIEGEVPIRYLDVYRTLYCIGKGGFGVVYEVLSGFTQPHHRHPRLPVSHKTAAPSVAFYSSVASLIR